MRITEYTWAVYHTYPDYWQGASIGDCDYLAVGVDIDLSSAIDDAIDQSAEQISDLPLDQSARERLLDQLYDLCCADILFDHPELTDPEPMSDDDDDDIAYDGPYYYVAVWFNVG